MKYSPTFSSDSVQIPFLKCFAFFCSRTYTKVIQTKPGAQMPTASQPWYLPKFQQSCMLFLTEDKDS